MTTSTTMHSENDPSEMPHPLAHATLYVTGPTVQPSFWTEYFGVKPSRSSTKGERFILPSGRISPRPAQLGLWGFRSGPHVKSDFLTPHLTFIKSYLSLPRSDARKLLKAQGATIALWCYWDNESGDRIADIPAFMYETMEKMGGTIELDEYR
jgi:hypothetical protein